MRLAAVKTSSNDAEVYTCGFPICYVHTSKYHPQKLSFSECGCLTEQGLAMATEHSLLDK